MKKITILLIVGILVSSSLGVAGIQTTHQANRSLSDHLTTPALILQSAQNDNSLILQLSGTDTYQSAAGCPRLPKIVKTIELPFGATDIKVTLTPQDISTEHIDQEIQAAPALLPLTPDDQSIPAQTPMKDAQIYAMTTPYPQTWYTTKIGVGLNKNNEHVTFVTIDYYPVRYTPATGTLLIASQADYTLTYTPPHSSPFPLRASYNLVIIAPKVFANALQPLIDHKNSLGVSTYLKTTEDIYTEYQGVDKPEQIKYFIKDA